MSNTLRTTLLTLAFASLVVVLAALAFRAEAQSSFTFTGSPQSNVTPNNPVWVRPGENVRLFWSAPDQNCHQNNFGVEEPLDGGTADVQPTTNTTYSMRCGNTTKTVSVIVTAEGPPAITSFSANPTSVVQGNNASITWSSYGTDTCTGSGFSTGGATSGTVSVTPTQSMNYYSIGCSKGSYSTPVQTLAISVTEPEFDASCSPNTTSASVGQAVTWNALAWNGTAPFTYEWFGQAVGGLTGSSVQGSYDTAGTKDASILVRDSSSQGAGMSTQGYDDQRCTGPALTGNISGDIQDGGNQELMENLAKYEARGVFRGGGYYDQSYSALYDQMATNPDNYCVEAKLSQRCDPSKYAFGSGTCYFEFDIRVHSGSGSRATQSGDFGDTILDQRSYWDRTRYYAVGKGTISSGVPQTLNRQCSVPITVTANAPTATLSANPISVPLGNPSTLTWSSTNATSCAGTNFVTANAVSGTTSVTPPSNTTYSVACTGQGGTAYATTTVSVTASSQPDLTAANVSSGTATAGVPVTLSATISNAGTGGTGAGFTNLFQRANDASGTGAVDIGTHSVAALAASASSNTSLSYTFPSPGNWYIRVCADKSSASSTGTITESNETNNCSGAPWTPVTVGGGGSGTLSCTVNDSTVPITVTAPANVQYRAIPGGGAGAPYTWVDGLNGSYGSGTTVNRSIPSNGLYDMSVSTINSPLVTAVCPRVTAGAVSCGTASASISANPDRVRADNNTGTTLTYSAAAVDTTCSISGPNIATQIISPPGACAPISGTLQTPQITAQSVYRISCDNGEATDEAVVNLIPKFIEF